MSGYQFGGFGGYPPHQEVPGGFPPPPPGAYPPPTPGAYPPPTPGAYPPPPPGAYPPPGAWIPPNQGYGWLQGARPLHCQGELHWIHCEPGEIPQNAVYAGRDKDGGPLYAGRAYHGGDLLPAKIAPSHHKAYVPWGGKEHEVNQFEVLISHQVAWVEDRDGRVPPEAVVVGQTVDGENLYMGRTMHDGTLTPGKIQPSHQCLYIPYGGEELKYHTYEALVLSC
ncbi:calcium-binding protein P-like [Macrosteles quadrilineatus]|uniref:calcium-binding protein P-like n=1 Tax=Macrosteles quadrilineatus TaxID=74068 RepID=UPI0023E12F6E|nr:calcium-binding protein P-like [Macrosteles quadrilineatus]